MRQTFDPQLSLGQTPIDQIQLNGRSRFELIAVLAGLQYVEADAALRDQILEAVASDVLGSRSGRRGRGGMSFWQILVLAVIHHMQYCQPRQLTLKPYSAEGQVQEVQPIRAHVKFIGPYGLYAFTMSGYGVGH